MSPATGHPLSNHANAAAPRSRLGHAIATTWWWPATEFHPGCPSADAGADAQPAGTRRSPDDNQKQPGHNRRAGNAASSGGHGVIPTVLQRRRPRAHARVEERGVEPDPEQLG